MKTSLRTVYRALVALAVATFCAAGAEPPPVDVFPPIAEIRSVRGVAEVTLDAVIDPRSGLPAFAYETLAGVVPTLRVHPGDVIRMTVNNALPRERAWPNDVNVHFHGLSVPPLPPGDDVLTTIAHPGQTLHYRVEIPSDAEPGLYWYHPHAHGETYRQITGGMPGAIVIEGLERHLPALAAMRERVIVLRDVATGTGPPDEDHPRDEMPAMPGMAGPVPAPPRRRAAADPCRAEPGLQPTLNRQPRAKIGIHAGEQQFFRVLNASAARYFDLSVDGALLELVARDGIPLDAYPGHAATSMVVHVVLPPAGRGRRGLLPRRQAVRHARRPRHHGTLRHRGALVGRERHRRGACGSHPPGPPGGRRP